MASPLETTALGVLGNSNARHQTPARTCCCGLHAPGCQANSLMQMKFSDILMAFN